MLSSEGLSVVFVVRVTLLQEFLCQHLVNGKIKQVHLRIQMDIVHTHTHGFRFSVQQTWNEKILTFSSTRVGYS